MYMMKSDNMKSEYQINVAGNLDDITNVTMTKKQVTKFCEKLGRKFLRENKNAKYIGYVAWEPKDMESTYIVVTRFRRQMIVTIV